MKLPYCAIWSLKRHTFDGRVCGAFVLFFFWLGPWLVEMHLGGDRRVFTIDVNRRSTAGKTRTYQFIAPVKESA